MERSILLIEDDEEVAKLAKLHIEDQGYMLDWADDGQRGLELAISGDYDLIILDLMLPSLGGLEVCKLLREKNKVVPVLMLTSRSEEIDRVVGLEVGADDYLTKPFSFRELLARIKALLRRSSMLEPFLNDRGDELLQFRGLQIDLGKRKVTLDGAVVELTAREFDLLAFLASRPGRPFYRQELLRNVWGYDFGGYEHTVNSHINRLRSKIEVDLNEPQFIKTVWGVGYKFAEEEELEEEDADTDAQ